MFTLSVYVCVRVYVVTNCGKYLNVFIIILLHNTNLSEICGNRRKQFVCLIKNLNYIKSGSDAVERGEGWRAGGCSWQQFVRVTNLRQVKVNGASRGRVWGQRAGDRGQYKYDMHYGANPGRQRWEGREREAEAEGGSASWPHAATLICAFPSWVRKTKRRRCCLLPLPDSKLPGLKTLSSHTAGLQSPLSRFLPPCPPCPASCWVQKLIALEKLHRVAHVPWQLGNGRGQAGHGAEATLCAKLALI